MKINGLRLLTTSNTQYQNALNLAMSQWNASQQSPWDLLSQYSAIINGAGAPQMPVPPLPQLVHVAIVRATSDRGLPNGLPNWKLALEWWHLFTSKARL
jgi:hypothetical protein